MLKSPCHFSALSEASKTSMFDRKRAAPCDFVVFFRLFQGVRASQVLRFRQSTCCAPATLFHFCFSFFVSFFSSSSFFFLPLFSAVSCARAPALWSAITLRQGACDHLCIAGKPRHQASSHARVLCCGFLQLSSD